MAKQRRQGHPAGKRPKQEAPVAAVQRSAAQRSRRRRLGGTVFGVLLIALFAWVAIAQGLGTPSVSSDDAAVVEDAPDGSVTREELTSELERNPQTARLEEGSAEYDQAVDSILDELILTRWFEGEAAERDITVSESEIDDQLETTIEQQLGGQEEFDQFLKQQGFTEDEVRERIRLQILSQKIQEELVPAEPSVSEDELKAVYDENADQFTTPESRDVRLILTRDREEAEAALGELADDSSPEAFERVAKQYSTDEATRNSGGLREGVVEGQSDPELDEAIFSAPEGELVGPIDTQQGYYVLQVEAIDAEQTVSFEEASPQLEQTLVSARRDQLTQQAVTEFFNKWQSRTFCASDLRIPRCDNAPDEDTSAQDCPQQAALGDPDNGLAPTCAPAAGTEACTEEVIAAVGCAAAVPGIVPQPPQELPEPEGAAALSPTGTPQVPTPAWAAEIATLSQTFVPGRAQNAWIEPPSEAEQAAGAGGIPPELQQQIPQGAAPQGAPAPTPQGAAPTPAP
ncbi:hypothetical protein HJD18_12825 [Thermoleophilia bacterium SCSIO 60948]|nr:hypothetical protein HJD18_12825 [Thermoleophilia bacterium SCSIO 60948]